MTIRPMLINDYDSLHALWLSTPGMGLNDLDDSREGIARYLARNPNTCFVAEEDDVITGSIMCGHDGRRGYIYHTCVRADRQGEGIGHSLVEAALDASRPRASTRLHWWSSAATRGATPSGRRWASSLGKTWCTATGR